MNRRLSIEDRVLAVARARMFLNNWYRHIKSMSRTFPDLYSMTRSFISPPSFNIFNRLCDTLIAHVIAYGKYYRNHPFCPWIMGTGFVEHFFGLSRSLLPDFSYAELLKMVKHIMLRQKLLLSGNFNDKRERKSQSGYILDYDASPLTEEELLKARVTLTTVQINQLVDIGHREADAICQDLLHMPVSKRGTPLIPLIGPAQGKTKLRTQGSGSDTDDDEAFKGDEEDGDEEGQLDEAEAAEDIDEADTAIEATRDAARYSELCEQYGKTVQESESQPQDFLPCIIVPGAPLPPHTPHPPSSILFLTSELLDRNGNLAVSKMLDVREKHQSGTSVRSERILAADTKFDHARAKSKACEAADSDEIIRLNNLSVKEGSHRVRVAQDMAGGGDKPKKLRQMRWQNVASELTRVIPVKGLFSYTFRMILG